MTEKILSMIDLSEPEIWSIQANRLKGLSDISQMICGQLVEQGGMVAFGESKLLHLWSHKLLLVTSEIDPSHLTQLENNLTDVSHGYSFLQIEGDSTLEFINAHVPLDLENEGFQTLRAAKTQFENYSVIFWWDQPDTVQLLIDRSYTKSFREYSDTLIHLWKNL